MMAGNNDRLKVGGHLKLYPPAEAKETGGENTELLKGIKEIKQTQLELSESLSANHKEDMENHEEAMKKAEEIRGEIAAVKEQLTEHLTRIEDAMTSNHGFLVNLIVSMPSSDIPHFLMLLPDTTKMCEKKGVFGKARQFFKTFKKKVGWKVPMLLCIMDEGPTLLGHDGDDGAINFVEGGTFEIEVPGALMRKMAPALIVFSKILKVAAMAGKVAGMPIPAYLPGIGDLKDSMPFLDDFAAFMQTEVYEGDKDENGDLQGYKELGDVIGDVATSLEAGSKAALKSTDKIQACLAGSYEAHKELLETKTDGEWEALKKACGMLRVVDLEGKDEHAIHWVDKKHLQELEENKSRFNVVPDGVPQGSGVAAVRSKKK